MTKIVQRIELDSMSPGTERFVKAHRYGKPGARPKAYLQASLHADEIPGMLITGDTAPDRIRESAESGLLLLHKPVANSRLRAAITHLVARPARRAEPSQPEYG